MGTTILYLFRCIISKFLKILFKHICNFLKSCIIFCSITPRIFWIKDFRVDSSKGSRILEVEDWKSIVLGFGKWTIMNCINYISSCLNANSLKLFIYLPFQLHIYHQSILYLRARHEFHVVRSFWQVNQHKLEVWMA